MDSLGTKTVVGHWDKRWDQAPRMTLPSTLRVGTRDRIHLLKRYVRPGTSLLEIGCAPGKILAYAAVKLGARVSGLDYSPNGMRWTRELFHSLGIAADLRTEDLFTASFRPDTFDVVHSAGLIEHFDDPKAVVRRHVELTKRGGTTLITIPDFSGVYGRMAKYFSPSLLALHNLSIMNCVALEKLAPIDLVSHVECFPAGHLSVDTIAVRLRWPGVIERPIYYITELLGSLQPVTIRPLCPWLVLEMKRC